MEKACLLKLEDQWYVKYTHSERVKDEENECDMGYGKISICFFFWCRMLSLVLLYHQEAPASDVPPHNPPGAPSSSIPNQNAHKQHDQVFVASHDFFGRTHLDVHAECL
jgi:hypothetical protein